MDLGYKYMDVFLYNFPCFSNENPSVGYQLIACRRVVACRGMSWNTQALLWIYTAIQFRSTWNGKSTKDTLPVAFTRKHLVRMSIYRIDILVCSRQPQSTRDAATAESTTWQRGILASR